MRDGLGRGTAASGLVYVVALAANVIGTTDGPRPNAPAVKEAARIAAQHTAIRWSALLGLVGSIAFCAFVIGLALLAMRAGRQVAAAALATAGVLTTGLSLVSFAALATAAQVAQRGAPPDLTLAFGDLHSTTLLAAFATSGAVLVGALVAGLLQSRPGQLATLVVAVAAIASAALVLDERLDMGPFGGVVVVPFLGLPIWVAAMSVRLLRGRLDPERTGRQMPGLQPA